MPDSTLLRSDEVREILTKVPHWLIRWGSVMILLIILLFFAIAWTVKYPEIISTQIVITTNTPPEKITAKTTGKIEAIFVKNREIVHKNTPLAVIENTADYQSVFRLKNILDTIQLEKSHFPFRLFNAAELGDIESNFAIFQKEYTTNELNLKLQPYRVESNAQNFETVQIKERQSLLESQKDINKSELVLQKKELERYETLYQKGIIATQEIEKQRLQFLQAQKNYKSVLSSISQLKSSLNDLNRNKKSTLINENKENKTQERSLLEAFYQLKKAIKTWELNYVLRSSIEGKVTFLQIWSKNQNINAGDNVFTIIPSKENGYVGKAKATAQNSGKIKVEQTVHIRLANYPDKEYGMLKGKVKAISLTPDKDGNLFLDIALPNGLVSSYHKPLAFQQEMSGTAEIITDDLRLLQRFMYQFRELIPR